MPLGPWSTHEETTAILRGAGACTVSLGGGETGGEQMGGALFPCVSFCPSFPRAGLGLLSRARSREKREERLQGRKQDQLLKLSGELMLLG